MKYTLLVPIFAFLEWMGTITMRVQKAIVHILQPLIVVAGIVLALLFAANPHLADYSCCHHFLRSLSVDEA